jgi:hypothetical protein
MILAAGVYVFRMPNIAHYVCGRMHSGKIDVTNDMVNDPRVIDMVAARELTYAGPIARPDSVQNAQKTPGAPPQPPAGAPPQESGGKWRRKHGNS